VAGINPCPFKAPGRWSGGLHHGLFSVLPPGACSRRVFRICALVLLAGAIQASALGQPAPAQSVVLDRVEAVVNNQPILSSDVDDAIRLSALDTGSEAGTLTRARALDELISRALIRQQMRPEEVVAATPTQPEVEARLNEIRSELPECAKENCGTETGWEAFLAAHGLTEGGVETYLSNRMEILRFIEQRFRQGIRVSPQQVEAYYHDTLLPQYAPGVQPPRLESVSPRIEEILLQQQVNALFDDWLKRLREQGDIEVLDPALETTQATAGAGEAEE
jgi:peptidyl-prolyl cis-trans isomerase SurA